MRAIMFGLVLAASTGAFAKAPAGQGKPCDAKNACTSGLTCVAHAGDGKSTCEIVCTQSTKCPEDQRCVKDGAQMLCHSINDLIL